MQKLIACFMSAYFFFSSSFANPWGKDADLVHLQVSACKKSLLRLLPVGESKPFAFIRRSFLLQMALAAILSQAVHNTH